jgi:hypothetical protein
MRRVRQLILSQQILDDAAGRGNLVIVTPGVDPAARELLLVVRGRLWAQFVVEPLDATASVVARIERAWQRAKTYPDPGVDHDSLDQVHILERWLRKHDGHPAIVALDDEPDWLDLIAYARARTTEELTRDRLDDAVDESGESAESFAERDAVC